MTLRIRIDHGQDAGRTWRLAKEGVYVMGRVPSVPLQVLDMKVSKAHATVTVTKSARGVQTVLQDLGSTHGSLVNGQPVHGKVNLKAGDEIRVGLSILRVQSDGKADIEPEPTRGIGTSETETNTDKAAGTVKKTKRVFAPDELVNTEIGGYKVLEKIGQGGMGSVYVAEQLSLNREVAFKVLSPKFTADSNFVDQFVNEARSAAALNHPNVVQVYDVGRQNGTYYFSMEFVTGGSIEEQLAEKGPADWRKALNWMMDAANALIFANKREILHRDVKPDNLMLAEDGSAKLCDLGLAKKAANADMLAAGIIGTPAFISPEAIRRRKDIDVRSDLYSLGCTFYRILTGENPYPGKTVKEILVGHLKAPVPKVIRKKPQIPAQFDEAIQKLMAKEPEERFQTPQDLLQALDKIRVQHGLEAHGLRPASRKPLVIALIAVVLLAGGALAFLLSRDDPAPPPPDPEVARRAAELEARAKEAALASYVSDQGKALSDLELEVEKNDLETGENFKLDLWPRVISDFEALADQTEAHASYGDSTALEEVVHKARLDAARIEGYVETRKRLEKFIKTGTAEAEALVASTFGDHRKAIDDALEAKGWVKAGLLVRPEVLTALVKPLLEKTIDSVLPRSVSQEERDRLKGRPLLDPATQIQPAFQELFPGDPPGADLFAEAVAGVTQEQGDLRSAIAGLIEEGTHESLEQAREATEAWIESLPDTVDPKSGAVAKVLADAAKDAESALQTIERSAALLLAKDLAHDRTSWFFLLRGLRKPGGSLVGFDLDKAETAAKATLTGMRHPAYKRLAQQMLEDVQALKHLMGRLVSTYPDGWSKNKVSWTNDRGRETNERVRAVTPQSIKLGQDDCPFAANGPHWVLRHVFYADPETTQEPRFAFEGEDFRGLAVLAEMAVEYDLLPGYLQAYAAWLPADQTDSQNAVRLRMGTKRMRLEQAAGEAWTLAYTTLRDVRTAIDAMDPELIGEDEFWADKAGRKAFVETGGALTRRLTDALAALNQFRNNKEFAQTVWGIISRSTPRLDVPYAGEGIGRLTLEPPKDAGKPGDGKPGDGKPEDDKPEDGGGEKPDGPEPESD